ncbi:DUF3987 domain-containing protein, partial [Desulfovibrio sp. OttesenSCG-928-A18]|nr:DUF3987 domain-containing protein [Desulfovibrio sp. OttesenSCG-928-A18]
QGREYLCSDLAGGGGDSLRVNMDSGRWADFAAGDDAKGGDLVSLVAAVRGMKQPEAARVLSEMAGVSSPPTATSKRQQKEKPAAIVPAPDGVKPPASFKHYRFGEPVATWEYQDSAGRLLGFVARFNHKETDSRGKTKKDFCPMVYTAQGWRWQGFPEPRPLYGLHRLAQAAPAASVLLVEGEGKADALQEALGANVAVLSLCGGSKAVARLDFSPLQGRKVICWPDADEPGAKAALLVCTNVSLAGAASVAVAVPPDGVPEGWDGADAIQSGWDYGRLVAHIKKSTVTHEAFMDVAARWGVHMECQTPDSGSDAEAHESESRVLPPPPPVPLEAFPAPVAAMLEEAAEAFTVPLQIPATCLLGVLSCLVGGTRLISLRPSWKEPGNIWIATVAASGIGKTPCAAAFFAPVKRLEYEAFRQWQDEYASYENEVELVRKERAKAKRGDPMPARPIQPQRRQAYIDDATVEALGEVLSENPRGIMWRKDELAGLIADLDKYSSGNSGGGTRSRLLSSYDGQEWKTSRTSNPTRNLYIPHAYVGIFGGIQPAMLPKVFEAGSAGVDEASGFLQRFMLIRAEREKPGYWTERYLSQDSKELLASIATALWSWDIEYDAESRELEKVVPVSRQAKGSFVEWFNGIAQEEFLSHNAALLSKLKGQAQRLCLLLHCLDAALAGNDGMGIVTEDCMRRALMLANWVKEHQEQCWRFFTPEKGAKQAGPLERAIMAVVVENAARIEGDGWKIANSTNLKDGLIDLVVTKLNMPGLSNKQIGKAAAGLGLPSCLVGERRLRGRLVTAEKIEMFKATVSHVSHVSVYSVPRVSGRDSTVSEPSRDRLTPYPAWAEEAEARQCRDSGETVPSQHETIAPQQGETCETCETVPQAHSPEFDFNDPAFPDECRAESDEVKI